MTGWRNKTWKATQQPMASRCGSKRYKVVRNFGNLYCVHRIDRARVESGVLPCTVSFFNHNRHSPLYSCFSFLLQLGCANKFDHQLTESSRESTDGDNSTASLFLNQPRMLYGSSYPASEVGRMEREAQAKKKLGQLMPLEATQGRVPD